MLSVAFDSTASNVIACGTVLGAGALLYNIAAASAPPGLTGIANAIENPTSTDTYAIVLRYTTTGYPNWTTTFGGSSGTTIASACATDAVNSVYACGQYTCSTCTFGSYGVTFTRLGTQDGYVIKVLSNTAYAWAARIGSAGSTVSCRSITIDPLTQNVVVSGTYTAPSSVVVVYTVSGIASGVTLPVTSTALPFTIELKAT